ncbi:chromosome segregation ATPase [Aeromonas salmonicida]|nr:chromosome segregation ATPase [Aeromonas salmonicida]
MRIVIIVKIYIMNKFWGLALLPLSVHFAASADDLVAPALKNSIAAGKVSQQRVEKAADAAVAARLELQNAQLQLRDLEAYNRYMQSLVADQQNELGKLSQQLEAVQETRQGLIPLMLQMQADLEQLVQDDLPLRKEDRLARVEQLKATLARADVSEAEKFRQLLQAYQIEAEYGSRMDSYSAELALDGAQRRVDVLALGRVSLLAMTADRSQAWCWSTEAKQWQALDSQWLSPIADALEMATDKKVPQLLHVPLSVSRSQEAQS